jgi:hypothetical protein
MDQVVVYLPSKPKALSSNCKKKKRRSRTCLRPVEAELLPKQWIGNGFSDPESWVFPQLTHGTLSFCIAKTGTQSSSESKQMQGGSYYIP